MHVHVLRDMWVEIVQILRDVNSLFYLYAYNTLLRHKLTSVKHAISFGRLISVFLIHKTLIAAIPFS